MKKLFITFTFGFILGLSFFNTMQAQSPSVTTPAFRTTLDTHLNAISTRNLDALLPTITDGKDLPMISPSGFKYDTRQQFVDFHRQWFAAYDKGKLDFEVVQVIESLALAHALVRYRYSRLAKDGKTESNDNWLALTFALEKNSWRLVFDQNTAISSAAKEK
jgi:hypothetical protein